MRSPAALCLLLATCAAAAHPDREIRLINPYPASGPVDLAGSVPVNRVLRLMQNHAAPALTDILAAQVRQALTYDLDRSVALERRPRQATLEAHRHVARAEPDGCTLLLSGNASIVILPRLARDAVPAAHGELRPVAMIARLPLVLISGAKSGLRSIPDLIDAARRRPARLYYGSTGDYSTAHLAGALFEQRTGIQLVHVPYNGGTAAVNAALAGQVETTFAALPAAMPHLLAGRLRALGIAAPDRYPALPGLPTIGEAGIPGFEAAVWYGIFAPARTPQRIVERLDAAISASLHSEQSRAQWLGLGVLAVHVGAADFDRLLRGERAKWSPVIGAVIPPD
jgi:tripartite-type tricarboxylate transporter receptor subunit TctC